MTDRELLELAAKAAGMKDMRYSSLYSGMVKMLDPTRPETTGSIGPNWNPLTDDADALRLAVKIKWVPSRIEFEKLAVQDDPYAATRRAIVRAAAEIGRNMKMTYKTLLTDEEIKTLAREAGCPVVTDRDGIMTFQAYGEDLRKFVILVAERAAAAEREWLIEKAESSLNSLDETCSWFAAGYAQGIRDFVAAIRARGEA